MAESLCDSPPSQGPSCPVCYRDYCGDQQHLIPRILQCGHTYCSECLERLLNTRPEEDDYRQIVLNIRYAGREWTTSGNYHRHRYTTDELKCPTCMTMNHVPKKDISSLTKNFALLGCRPHAVPRSKHFCKDHNHDKRIYCNDCMSLICAYCQLYGGHKGHSFMVATEACKPSIDTLKEAEEGLVEDLEKLTRGKGEVSVFISKLDRNRRRCERNVKKYFNRATKKLAAQKDLLLSQIAFWTEEQMFVLNSQLEMLTKSTKDLKSLQSSCQSLVLGDPLDALTDHQKVEDDVKTLRSHVNDLSLQPLLRPWMQTKADETCDDMLAYLVNNFKLTYGTQIDAGEGKEGEEDQNLGDESDDDECDSSVDILYEEVDLVDAAPEDGVSRQSGRKSEPRNSADRRMEGRGAAAGELMHLQNARAGRSSESTVGSEPPHFSIGQDLDWISSIPFSQQLLDESESTISEADNAQLQSCDVPNRRLPARLAARLRMIRHRRRLETSINDSDQVMEPQRSHDSSLSGGGVETILDPVNMQRRWDFLNSLAGENLEDEEDDRFQSLPNEPEARSAHSDDSSPSPHPNLGSTCNTFSFPHHLSSSVDLSPDNDDDDDDEVVLPSSPLFSRVNQRAEPLQLSLLEEVAPLDLDYLQDCY